MTPEERLYQDAREAITANDLPLARKLFTQLLKLNRNNPEYWIWMSGVVETRKERVICLKEVLKLDPGNLTAIRGLRLADENIEDPSPRVGLRKLKQDWKTSLEMVPPKTTPPSGIRGRIFVWTLLGVLVIGAATTGIVLGLRPRYRPDISTVMKFSLTPPPTATTGITPSPTFAGPVPLWTLLEATFTPTPLYVATPHNRTEAYRAAMRAYDANDWTKALDYFNQVLTTEPNSPDIHFHIGEIYRFQKAYKNAGNSYDAAIKIDPNFAPAYLGKGRVQFYGSPTDLKNAEMNFKKALELDPMLHEALYEMAELSLAQGDAEAALAWISQIEDSMPESAQVEILRAQVYLLQGQNELALSTIEKANKLDITSLPVYKLWGKILQINGRYKDSLEPLNTFLTYNPSDPETEILLARAYASAGKLDAALEAVNQALASDNKLVSGLVTRGEIYLLQKETDLADKDFSNALLFDPNSFDANIGKARISLLQDYPGLAYEYIKKAEDHAQGIRQDSVFLYWRAITLINLNETNAAIRDLEAILAFSKDQLPEGLRDKAIVAYLPLVTPTPSMTPTITRTRTATFTPSPTPTIMLTPKP